MTTNVDDTADADTVRQTITVQGCQADYYESEKYRVLLWENEEGFLLCCAAARHWIRKPS